MFRGRKVEIKRKKRGRIRWLTTGSFQVLS